MAASKGAVQICAYENIDANLSGQDKASQARDRVLDLAQVAKTDPIPLPGPVRPSACPPSSSLFSKMPLFHPLQSPTLAVLGQHKLTSPGPGSSVGEPAHVGALVSSRVVANILYGMFVELSGWCRGPALAERIFWIVL